METLQDKAKESREVPGTPLRLKRISQVWWTIYLIMSVLMFFGFLFLLYQAYLADFFWIPAIFILPMMIASMVLSYSSISKMTLRLSVTRTSIQYRDLLTNKEIPFQEVQGFRLASTAFLEMGFQPGWEVEILSTHGALITVPKSIENQGELIAFLSSRFQNLDEDSMKVYLKWNRDN